MTYSDAYKQLVRAVLWANYKEFNTLHSDRARMFNHIKSMSDDAEMSENDKTMFSDLIDQINEANIPGLAAKEKQKEKFDQRMEEVRIFKERAKRLEEFDEDAWYGPYLETKEQSQKWLDATEKFRGDDPILKEYFPVIRERIQSGESAEDEISTAVRARELHELGEMEIPAVVPFNHVLYHGSAHVYEIPRANRAPVDTIHTPKAYYLTSDWATAVEYAHESSYEDDDSKAQVYEVEVDAKRMVDCSGCRDPMLVSYSVLKAYDDGLDGVLIPATTSPTRGLDPVPEVLLFRPDKTAKIVDVHIKPDGWGDEYRAWNDGVEGPDGRIGPPRKRTNKPDPSMVSRAVSDYKQEYGHDGVIIGKSAGYQGGAPKTPVYSPRGGRGKIGH